MKYLIKKEKIKRILFLNKELIFSVLKFLKKNTKIIKSIRWKASSFFFKINQNKFKTKIVNRCIISGRQKGILTKFKLSRILFAKYAYSGNLFSIKSYS